MRTDALSSGNGWLKAQTYTHAHTYKPTKNNPRTNHLQTEMYTKADTNGVVCREFGKKLNVCTRDCVGVAQIVHIWDGRKNHTVSHSTDWARTTPTRTN